MRFTKGPTIIVKHPSVVIESMDEWCRKHHGESGLSNLVLGASSITMKEAEEQVLAFIKKHIPEKRVGLLAGNSVHADKEFLRKDMPSLLEHLHYRIIDTSTIKELCKSWNPQIYSQVPQKMGKHRALDDILESIQELSYYKSFFFNIIA